MNTEFDYSKEITIDLARLDREWKHHPELVIKYGEAKADAQRDVDLAKESLEIVIAEVDTAIREAVEESGEKKPSEKSIEKQILQDQQVKEAKAMYIDAKHRMGLLSAACEGFNARGQALSNLVKLWGASYFAEPEADIEDRGKIDRMINKSTADRIKIGKRTKSADSTMRRG